MLMKMNKNRKTGTGLIYQPTKVQALSISKGARYAVSNGIPGTFKFHNQLFINDISF